MIILRIIFSKLYYSVYYYRLQDVHIRYILFRNVIGTISTIFCVPTYNTAKI